MVESRLQGVQGLRSESEPGCCCSQGDQRGRSDVTCATTSGLLTELAWKTTQAQIQLTLIHAIHDLITQTFTSLLCMCGVPEGLISTRVSAVRGRRCINLLSSRGCTGGQNLRMI